MKRVTFTFLGLANIYYLLFIIKIVWNKMKQKLPNIGSDGENSRYKNVSEDDYNELVGN